MALAPLKFTNGDTLTTADQQVELLYVAYFGRAGDPQGETFWDTNLAQGQTIDQVAANFAASAEAQNLYPFLAFPTIDSDSFRTSFINSIYQNLFDRPADQAGLQYWDDQLHGFQTAFAAGQITAQQFQADVAGFILQVARGAQNSSAGQDIATMEAKDQVASFFTSSLATVSNQFNGAAHSEAGSVVAGTTATNVASQEAAVNTFIATNNNTITDNVGGTISGHATTGGAVNEGGPLTLTVHTLNVAAGTVENWSLAGTALGQVTSAHAGTVTIGADGTATISVTTLANTFGADQNLTLSVSTPTPSTDTVAVHEATQIITNTAGNPVTSVNEGNQLALKVSETGSVPGTALAGLTESYTITGNQIPIAERAGTVTLDSQGTATLNLDVLASVFNSTTPGSFTITFSSGATQTIAINETAVQTITDTAGGTPSGSPPLTTGGSIAQGQSVTFNVATTGVPASSVAGVTETWTLTGAAAGQVAGPLSGTLTLDSSGHAAVSTGTLATVINGPANESMVFSVFSNGTPVSTDTITVNEGTETVATPTTVNEGGQLVFNISSANLPVGLVQSYTLSGAGIGQVTSPLTGTVTIGANGTAQVVVNTAATVLDATGNPTFPPNEPVTLTLTGVNNGSGTGQIAENATISVTAPSTETGGNSVSEGSPVTFTLAASSNVPVGTMVSYTLSGTALGNVALNQQTGTATVNPNGTVTITIPTIGGDLSGSVKQLTITLNGLTNDAVNHPTVATANINENSQGLFVLTTGTDAGPAFTGNPVGDNTFIATNLTLGQNDHLTGGNNPAAPDTLVITSSGFGPAIINSFTTTGIAQQDINANANPGGGLGTSIDESGVTGLSLVTDDNSSANLMLNNVQNQVGIAILNPSQIGGGPTNLTVNYIASAQGGNQQVKLTNSLGPVTQLPNTLLTVNGVPSMTITDTGPAGTSDGLAGIVDAAASAPGLSSLTILGLNNFVLGTSGVIFHGTTATASSNTLDLTNLGGTFYDLGTVSSAGGLTIKSGVGGIDATFPFAAGGPVGVVESIIAAGNFELDMGAGSVLGQNISTTGAHSTILITPTGGSSAGGLTGSLATNNGNITINGGINGGINEVISSGTGIANVTGGTGDDTFDFQNGTGFHTGDVANGGGGNNTLILQAGVAGAGGPLGGHASNFQTLDFNSGTFGNGTPEATALAQDIDFALLDQTGIAETINVNTTVNDPNFLNLAVGVTNTINIDNALAGLTLGTGVVSLGFSGQLTGSQSVNLNITDASGAVVTVADFNAHNSDGSPVGTLTFGATQDGSGNAGLTLFIGDGAPQSNAMGGLTHLNFVGDEDITIGLGVAPAVAATITNVDGHTDNANLDLTHLAPYLNVNGATITLGDGNNTVVALLGTNTITVGNGDNTITGGAGADTINFGSGTNSLTGGTGADVFNEINPNPNPLSVDTFHYKTIFDSSGVLTDTINGFRSGTDKLDLLPAIQTVNPNAVSADDIIFWGNAPNTVAALAALQAIAGNGLPQAVYDESTHTLLVDANGDGVINGNDMTIIVDPTGAGLVNGGLQAQDLNTQPESIFLANTAAFNTHNALNNVFATNADGAVNHLIIATAAQLVGAVIQPGGPAIGGTNILDVTTALATTANFDFNTSTNLNGTVGNNNIQLLELRAGSGPFTVFAPNIVGLTIDLGAADPIQTGTSGGHNLGQTVNGSGQGDTIFVNNSNDVINGRGGNNNVEINAGFTFSTGTLNGGGAPGNNTLILLNGSDISGITSVGTQINGFDGVTFAAGSETINVAENQAFASGAYAFRNFGGTQTVHIADSGTVTGLAQGGTFVNTYSLDGAGTDTLTLGDADQNVTDNAGETGGVSNLAMTIVDTSFNTLTGTYTGDRGTSPNDNLELDRPGNTVNISGATLNGLNHIVLDGSTNLTFNEAQNNASLVSWLGITGTGANTVTITNVGGTFNPNLGLLHNIGTVVATGLGPLHDDVQFSTDTSVAVHLGALADLTVTTTGGTDGNVTVDNAGGGSQNITTVGGNDSITASGNADTISSGGGNDTVTAGGNADHITTGSGADTITANGTAEVIVTGDGGDTVSVTHTGAVGDNITGGTGNDSFTFNGTSFDHTTTVNGGTGTDTLTFTDSGDTTSLNNVAHVEKVVFGDAPTNQVVANTVVSSADGAVTFDGSGIATHTFTLDLSGVTDNTNAVTVKTGAGASTITGTDNSITDTYVLGSGTVNLTLHPAATHDTAGNIGGVDTIQNFNATTPDVIHTGLNAAGVVLGVALASTSAATFIGDVNTALINNGIVLGLGNGQLVDVTVASSDGSVPTGQYVIEHTGAGYVSGTDFAVHVVGTLGSISNANVHA